MNANERNAEDLVAALTDPPPYIGDEAFTAFLEENGCSTSVHSFRKCFFGAAICPWREADVLVLAERLFLQKPSGMSGRELVDFLQPLLGLYRQVEADSRRSPFALSPVGKVESRDGLLEFLDRRVDEIYLGFLEGVWQYDRKLPLTPAEAKMITSIEAASNAYENLGFDFKRDGGALEAEALREIATLDKHVEETVAALVETFRESPSAERQEMTRSGELIDMLAHSEGFPTDAVRECLDRRDDMIPLFLQMLRNRTERPNFFDDREEALFLIVHMLGELGEQQAFASLMDLLSTDSEHVEQIFGDAITETLPKILIGVFDGDTARLYRLIENDQANEFVRTAAFECWTYCVAAGRIDRAEAERYLQAASKTLEPKESHYVWIAWLDAIALLGFVELKGAVRNAYDIGLVDPMNIRYGEFEDIVETAGHTDDLLEFLASKRLVPFSDTIGTLSKWHGYSEEFLRKRREGREEEEADWTDIPPYEPVVSVTNPMRGVGRNDPCPCGSGKKYKKCCLR